MNYRIPVDSLKATRMDQRGASAVDWLLAVVGTLTVAMAALAAWLRF